MEPDDLLCSRNARSQTTLVGHAQWDATLNGPAWWRVAGGPSHR